MYEKDKRFLRRMLTFQNLLVGGKYGKFMSEEKESFVEDEYIE
jgi:hypothetical protein